MRSSIACLTLLLDLAAARPHFKYRRTAMTTKLTFTGATVELTISPQADGSVFTLRKPFSSARILAPLRSARLSKLLTAGHTAESLSVDHIAQDGQATCTFNGVDHAQLTVIGPNNGTTFAPPQVVAEGRCVMPNNATITPPAKKRWNGPGKKQVRKARGMDQFLVVVP